MIKTQGGDTGDYGFGYNVCGVVLAPDTDFEDSSINLAGRSTNTRDRNMPSTYIQRQECMKRDKRQHAEVSRFQQTQSGTRYSLDQSARTKVEAQLKSHLLALL